MRRTKIYLVTAAALLALAGCDHALEPAGGAISIEASVGPLTKVTYDGDGASFAAGDRVAVYAWTGSAASVPATRVVDGVVNTFDGTKWTPASLMRWADASTPHYFLGVSPAPGAAVADLTAVPYTLDPTDYTASDLLLATNFGPGDEGVKPSQTAVPLAFDHAMAKLAVNLKFRSQWATVPAVSAVTVTAKSAATVNYLTKSVTASGTAAPLAMPAAAAVPSGYDLRFSGIQLPQTGVRRIVVCIDGRDFVYEAATDIPLVGGEITTVGLNVGRDRIDLAGITVADWEAETLAEAEAEPDMLHIPLTIEAAAEGAVVTFDIFDGATVKPVQYRIWDGTTWSNWATYTDNDPVTLAATLDKVQFRSDNASYWDSGINYSQIRFDKDCYVYGNIMSLVGGEDFFSCFTLTDEYAFARLFQGNGHLLSHPSKRLLLPATELTESCYYGMFSGCDNLATAPELPAETLAKCCYDNMFSHCGNLTTAPELPAKTLAARCYESMFDSCEYLTAAPALPAETLADGCYFEMFQGCSSLTTAPVLPAATLVDRCYSGMFHLCWQLNQVTCMALNISAEECTKDWLETVAQTGTFTAPACMADVWPVNSISGIPPGWTFAGSPEGVGSEGFTLGSYGVWQ